MSTSTATASAAAIPTPCTTRPRAGGRPEASTGPAAVSCWCCVSTVAPAPPGCAPAAARRGIHRHRRPGGERSGRTTPSRSRPRCGRPRSGRPRSARPSRRRPSVRAAQSASAQLRAVPAGVGPAAGGPGARRPGARRPLVVPGPGAGAPGAGPPRPGGPGARLRVEVGPGPGGPGAGLRSELVPGLQGRVAVAVGQGLGELLPLLVRAGHGVGGGALRLAGLRRGDEGGRAGPARRPRSRAPRPGAAYAVEVSSAFTVVGVELGVGGQHVGDGSGHDGGRHRGAAAQEVVAADPGVRVRAVDLAAGRAQADGVRAGGDQVGPLGAPDGAARGPGSHRVVAAGGGAGVVEATGGEQARVAAGGGDLRVRAAVAATARRRPCRAATGRRGRGRGGPSPAGRRTPRRAPG